ncbi:MAG: SMP-30/gluconolactonase/LRE family protein [Burkholderiales bacterium]|nr:SMP-30/gluconolactonase/LRE family protein [Burkholderiales bacterium]
MTSLRARNHSGRIHWLASWGTPIVAVVAYLSFWPTGVNPVAWQAPQDVGYVGAFAPNQKLSELKQVPLAAGQEGPEHIAAYQGAVYTGLSNGDVVKMSLDGQHQAVVINTGGRPLGIDFDAQGRMLVADAYKGLLRVSGQGAQATIQPILTQVQDPIPNDPIRYADAVKVAPDGTIWVTDASRRFSAKQLGSTFEASVLDILEHSCTGRVIAVDPNTLQSRVALAGLCFPNGMAFSPDGKTMYLSETGTYRILKLDLPKLSVAQSNQGAVGVPTMENALAQGAATVLIDNLPGYPDNLMRSDAGRIWVGLTKPRSHLIDKLSGKPFVRSMVLRLPRFLWPVPKAYGHVIAFDDQGKIVDDLQDPTGAYPETTAATEVDGKLFIQSLHAHAIGWMPYQGPSSPH